MGTVSLLSAEVSKGRALAAGGASTSEILALLHCWKIRGCGSSRGSESILLWGERVYQALKGGERMGVPCARVLAQAHPMIVREERQWMRLAGLEKQYGLQGALAMVLPWCVAAMVGGGSGFSSLSAAGAGLQILGLLLFYLIVRKTTRPICDERVWLRDLMADVWLRVLCGQGVYGALEVSLDALEGSLGKKSIALRATFQLQWRAWFRALQGGAISCGATNGAALFHEKLSRSREAAALLHSLARSGAPAAETLSDWIGQINDECHANMEERLAGVPTALSLVFCFFLTPAVFLIMAGALWPMLQHWV